MHGMLVVRGVYSKIKRIVAWRLKNIIKQRILLPFLKKDIGRRTYIDKTVHITGWKYISIGDYSVVSEHTWINVNQRFPNHRHIIIGSNCYIGRRNIFSSGNQIIIGDYFMSGVECKLLGADHIFDDPCRPYISTGVTSDKSIKIGTNVWLGAGVIVIGNITIGSGSVIGAGTLINKDVPPFSLVIGNPGRIIKRYSFTEKKWLPIGEFSSDLELNLPDEKVFCEKLRRIYHRVDIPLQAASKRRGDLL
jgi:acetyltransferase-like isoleucine patch superfamily enzyme